MIICFVSITFFLTSYTLTQSADGGIIGTTAKVDIDFEEEIGIELNAH